MHANKVMIMMNESTSVFFLMSTRISNVARIVQVWYIKRFARSGLWTWVVYQAIPTQQQTTTTAPP